MLVKLFKISKVHFHLSGTKDFHVKAENERFPVVGLRCHQNLKYENFMSSFGRLCQKIAPRGMTCSMISFLHSSDHIISLICGIVVAIPVVVC